MRVALIGSIVFLFITAGCGNSFHDSDEVADLSGTWKFQLDSANVGMNDKWFSKEFNDSIQLPGTTDENKKGIFLDEKAVDRLSRVWYWKGAAWYQKEVTIPEHWEGKNVKLLLERTKDTYVWFDDINCGYENTLSAPQYFNLTKAVKPGKHRITILIDNAKLPPVGPSHAVDERTQTNWNGIVGRIELQVSDPVWIEEVQAYPDVKTRAHLQNGGKAIIFPDHDKLTNCIKGAFQTDYWCYPMFARAAISRGIEPAPGSLGFICNPDSPLLKHFPTEFHSNWQWWHLVKNCKPIILDDTPADYKPLIQTIDNFARNHKLGMIFETKFGKGSALICAIDLPSLQDKPEARQLYFSILNYVKSDQFIPEKEISISVLNKIIP